MSKVDKDTNVPNTDTISRQAAIETAIDAADDWDGGMNSERARIIGKALLDLPSAQPEKAQLSQEDATFDCISRQAAIDAFKPYAEYESNRSNKDWVKRIEVILSELPSAQPDLSEYSDKLWRTAYERGKKEAQPEIIRCKDCKYFIKSCLTLPDNICSYIKSAIVIKKPNGYCDFGERRTDG